MHKGTDSDGNFVVPSAEPEVWQQQGSKLQPMGTMRRGNGNVTGGVPFLATTTTHALTAEGSEQVTPTLRAGHGAGGGSVASAAAVRRLTPVECERLQGFPDGWTAKRADLIRDGNRWIPTGRGVAEQADSSRYRQLGNSIAVPVFRWVAEGIALAGGEW